MPKRLKIFIFILTFAVVLFFVKLFVFDFYVIEHLSMYKTVLNDDHIIISKYSRHKAGDIILYEDGNSGEVKISRVVAKEGDKVIIQGQDLYLNDELIKFKNTTYSYCFRYVSSTEADSLNQLYLMHKINNSGFFQVELSDREYEDIMNDSLSELRMKLVPIENCRYTIFSESVVDVFVPTVAEDSVFILNDNRSDLQDSRTIGLIPINKIIGKVIYVY